MPLSYRQVKDLYDVLADAGVTTESLPEWSTRMNEATGTDLYSSGLNDNILKRASVGIDRAIESVPGLVEGGKAFGGSIGGLFGMEDTGREIGANLPRMAVNLLPMLIPGVGLGATAARLGGMALLQGGQTYTETGSPAAGLVSGGLAAALPKITTSAEQGVLSFLRNRGLEKGVAERLLPRHVTGQVGQEWNSLGIPTVTRNVDELFGSTLGQKAASFTGGQAAANLTMGGSDLLSQALAGDDIQNPFTKEFALDQLIGQVPFTALHLTGKAMGGRSRADSLQAAITETEGKLALKRAIDLNNSRADNEKLPEITQPLEVDPEVISNINERLAKLGIERSAIESEPTTENVERRKQIIEEEDTIVEKLLEETGGIGVGIRRAETTSDLKIPVKGEKAMFLPNTKKGPNAGYYTINVTEVPPGTVDQKGVEVKPGDRVRFPAGMYDPAVNRDLANPEFLLPTRKGKPFFEVVEDRPPTERGQLVPKTITEAERATWPERRAWWDAEFKRQAEWQEKMSALERDASSVGSLSAFVDYLAQINELRAERGYAEIDLATLQRTAMKNKIRGNINAALALIEETKNQEIAEQIGKQKELARVERAMAIESQVRDIADSKVPHKMQGEMKEILALYEGASGASGNLGRIAATGKFWEVVEGLYKKSEKNLAKRVQAVIGRLASGEGLEKEKQAPPLKAPMFQPLDKNDVMVHKFVGEKLLEWVGQFPESEERQVLRQLIITGDWNFTEDSVREMSKELGFATTDVEANSFVDSFKERKFFGRVAEIEEQVLLDNARKHPARKIQGPRIAAGEDFVWDLAEYDPLTDRLGEKHTLPKSGLVPEALFKKIGGRTGELPQLELDLAKLVVPEAFKKGEVDVKLLHKLLPERKPVVTEVFTPEGKMSEAKAELNRMTHEWLDTLPRQLTSAIPDSSAIYPEDTFATTKRAIDSTIHAFTPEAQKAWSDPENQKRFEQVFNLRKQVASEPPDTTPRAQWMYLSSAEHGVGNPHGYFELAVAVPQGEKPSAADEARLKQINQKEVDGQGLTQAETAFKVEYSKKWASANSPLFSGQHLPFPPNTLIHLRGYFAEHPTEGRVLVLDEVQSDWGQAARKDRFTVRDKRGGQVGGFFQSRKEAETSLASMEDPSRYTIKEGSPHAPSHPLLPVAHVLGLKAVLAKIAKESPGTKVMVVSDVTAGQTEGHDKAGVVKTFNSVEEANAALQQLKKVTPTSIDIYNYLSRDKDNVTLKLAAGTPQELLNKAVELGFDTAQAQGMATAYRNTYYVIRDAEGKTLKGKVFRTEKEAREAVEGMNKGSTDLREGKTGFEDVPNNLLGFPKEGSTKAFEEHKYPFTLDLEISVDGGKTWIPDSVKGLNKQQAIERARRNWDSGVLLREPGAEKFSIAPQTGTLVSSLRSLTGDEGREVVMPGVHAKALGQKTFSLDRDERGYYIENDPQEGRRFTTREERQVALDELKNNPQIVGSPVFRDPFGNPETRITGTVFDTSAAVAKLKEQQGFTLSRPSASRQPKPYLPVSQPHQEVAKALTTDGQGLMQILQRSNDSEMRAIADDLLRLFPEALSLIKSDVAEVAGTMTWRQGRGRDMKIQFDPSMVATSPYARENVILHEIIHGLTIRELENPLLSEKSVTQLGELREHLIKHLPKQLKAEFDRATKSDWYNKFVDALDAGDEELAYRMDRELSSSEDGRNILYALLDPNETVSQGFSSRAFRNYMQETKGLKINGKNKNGLQAFAGWVRELLHLDERVSENAFEDFMGISHQLMANGEFLASAQKYGEGWFESKGKGKEYGKGQTARALGIIAESFNGISKDELVGSLALGEDKFNRKLERARKAMVAVFEGQDKDFVKALLNENGVEATPKGVNEFVENAIAEGRDVTDALELAPPEVSSFVFEKLRDHQDVLELLEDMAKGKRTTNIAKPELFKGPVTNTLKEIRRLLKVEEKQQVMAEELVALDGMEPRTFVERLAKAYPARKGQKEVEEPKSLLAKWASPLAWFAEPFTQIAHRIPTVAEHLTYIRQQKANANTVATDALKVLSMEVGDEMNIVTEKGLKEAEKVLGNPMLRGLVDRWTAINNIEGKDKVVHLPASHEKIAKLLEGRTPEERAMVEDIVVKRNASIKKIHDHVLNFMEDEAGIRGGIIVNVDMPGKMQHSVKVSRKLLRGILQMNDPMTQLTGRATIDEVQKAMEPQAFLNILEFLQGQAEIINSTKKYFDENPAWSTAQAMERFHFRYMKNGKPKRGQASSEKERDLIIQKDGGGKLLESKDTWKDLDEAPFVFPNMSAETARRIQEIHEVSYNMFKSRGLLDEAGLQAYERDISPAKQILREAGAAGGLPRDVEVPGRKLGPGTEDLPWMWNHVAYTERTANYWTRRVLRAQRDAMLRDPELTPEHQQLIKTHVDNLMQNDPIAAQAVVRTASSWFLGWNLAFNMINGTQPIVTHVPGLTAITGKPMESYRRVKAAAEEALQFRLKGKWNSEEHEWAMKKAQVDLQRGIGNRDEQEMLEDGVAVGVKRMLKKGKPQTHAQRIVTAAGAYSRASMWLARAGENFNADIALLAAFDLYRGMEDPKTGKLYTKEAALEKAYGYNEAVNYSGGRVARPVGAYSGRAPSLRSAAMIGTALQSYVLGTTATFARYIQHGFMKPPGVTPAQSHAARVALVQMAATQFAAAGLLGMPFVSGAIALLDKLFPDLEVNKNVRGMAEAFLSSDEENGGPLTDVAMTGIPSMLGWDMQSRLSMGNTLPGVSEVNGFQPENLMGPAVNIVKNLVNGVTGWAKGDAKAGLNFLPPAVRKLVEQVGRETLNQGEIEDYQGRPIGDTTRGERLGAAIGFQPKRLSDQNAAARILRQSDEVSNRRNSEENSRLAEEVIKRNFGTVQQRLRERAQEDKTFDPVAAVRAIARMAEEQTFPRDLRREGSKRTATVRSKLLESFSNLNIKGSPSEVERLQFRQGIQQRLGLLATSRSDFLMAQMMDQLRATRPDATRSELRAAAQMALRRSHPQELVEVP